MTWGPGEIEGGHITFFFSGRGGGLCNFFIPKRGGSCNFLREQEGGRVTFSVTDKFHPAPCHVNNERSLMTSVYIERDALLDSRQTKLTSKTRLDDQNTEVLKH